MLTVIKSSFIEYKLTNLRNKKTPSSAFRQTMNEISYLIAAEVLKHMKYKNVLIHTPLKKTSGTAMSQSIVIVPILRAGLGLVEGFIKFLPEAERGHIGLYRDEQTYEPAYWKNAAWVRAKIQKMLKTYNCNKVSLRNTEGRG